MEKNMANKNSEKNNKTNQSKKGFSAKKGKNKPASKQKEKLTKKQIIILISVTVLACIVSAGIIITVVLSKGSENPNLLKADLSKYVTISREDYANLDLNIPLDDTSDEAVRSSVQSKINGLLAGYKTLNKEDNGAYNDQRILGIGDTVDIYYRGYIKNADGRYEDFKGGSNILGDITVLEVGTGNTINAESGEYEGSFIPGFGESLIGKVPGTQTIITTRKDGTVKAGEVIYLSYTVIGEDETEENISNHRIDLSLSDVDAIYGTGFAEYFIGAEIGKDLPDAVFPKEGQTDIAYTDMKISCVTNESSLTPITIKVKFPATYGEASLRGVEAYFDVFVQSACNYDIPDFDDAFITEKLKVRADSLTSYEGATLAEKYTSKLTAMAKTEIEDSNVQLLSNAMWNQLMSMAQIKKIPKKALKEIYTEYYENIKEIYKTYQSQTTFNSFISSYLNQQYGIELSDESKWSEALNYLAEWDLSQKLIFYYIIREEEMLPSDEEYEEIYNIIYNDMLEYYIDLNREKLYSLDTEAYNKEIEALKSEIEEVYDEEYFETEIYKYYGTRKLIELNLNKK